MLIESGAHTALVKVTRCWCAGLVIVAVSGVSGLGVRERGPDSNLHAEGCQNSDPSMATQNYYGPSVNVPCSGYGHDHS